MHRNPLLVPNLLFCFSVMAAALLPPSSGHAQSPLEVQLRFQRPVASDSKAFTLVDRNETWKPSETAIIVCDVWDYHHSPNAVGRLQEMLPRLEAVLKSARQQGVTIIHSPSDCMDAYRKHPARRRAIEVPAADNQPPDIEAWCSAIPSEEQAAYPIDQSDGGEDDDRAVHAKWARKLTELGRNPNMPWQRQNEGITIDSQRDYLSDRGEEVWNILEHRNIRNVILTGVHTNMCVLGRPFGLRQMARNGKHVVLMRDMTDTMYNPASWPYVSHFEGTRRIISHIERFVCPTMTSDQWLGGKPFRFSGDLSDPSPPESDEAGSENQDHWRIVTVQDSSPGQGEGSGTRPQFFRCVVRMPERWFAAENADRTAVQIRFRNRDLVRLWINGKEQTEVKAETDNRLFKVAKDAVAVGDANLLVVQIKGETFQAPRVESGDERLVLAGKWQTRQGDETSLATMPLPAKFGGSSDIVFNAPDPLWTPRALTRTGDFTTGIEGPACDRHGNIFAVNFDEQGTIGKVTPNGIATLFVKLPQGSIGNGIRFAPDGTFFVADYTKHNVLRVDPSSGDITIHAHHPDMNQPNDLALAPDGKTLFASDPNWADGTGNLWRIDSDGTISKIAEGMGTTNGIEVSPDGKTLYVNESKQRNVWAFDITRTGTLSHKRLVRHFDQHGFDGMRCDVEGNLYITRHGAGTVIKMTPKGDILREIPVLGKRPSNLCFGGPDRKTLYVTEVDSQRLVQFRVDQPGRE